MILCDTNIIIQAFKQHQDTINILKNIGFGNVIVSSVSVMEILQGARNKIELQMLQNQIKVFNVLHFDRNISLKAVELLSNFNLSHNLQIPDAIIGATAITYNIEFLTYNLKDFRYIPDLKLYGTL